MTDIAGSVQRNLQALLLQLLPRAVSWAESVASEVAATGVALSDAHLSVANAVGVQDPSRVRVLMVDRFLLSNDPELQAAAIHLGLFGRTMTGLTLGYAIQIRNGSMSRRLLSHECRHVHQYEQAGSIGAFLTPYLEATIQFGSWNSPLEQDARAHELKEGSTDP